MRNNDPTTERLQSLGPFGEAKERDIHALAASLVMVSMPAGEEYRLHQRLVDTNEALYLLPLQGLLFWQRDRYDRPPAFSVRLPVGSFWLIDKPDDPNPIATSLTTGQKEPDMHFQQISEELTSEKALERLSGTGRQNGGSNPWVDAFQAMPFSDLSNVPIDDPIALYFFDVGQEPLLNAEEDVQLAREIEAGQTAAERLSEDVSREERFWLAHVKENGEAARSRLIRANMRLVVSIAKRYRGYGMPFLDLLQEGNIGLMKAVEKYDYERGNRFSTYATWWIRQAVTRALANQGRAMRIPANLVGEITRIYRTVRELEQELGQSPTAEEMAEVMDLSVDRIRWLLRISRWPVSLAQPVGDDFDGAELGDFLEDHEVEGPAEFVGRNQLCKGIDEILGDLPPRQARILRLRYGLRDGEVYTLKEVGDMFGLSREQIRRLEKDALHRLRQLNLTGHLRHYLE